MGSISARKVHRILDHVEIVIAIEMLCAIRGIEFHAPLKSSPILELVKDRIRKIIPATDHDTIIHHEITSMKEIVSTGELLSIISTLNN
jgi:histidine ammonia-lyase